MEWVDMIQIYHSMIDVTGSPDDLFFIASLIEAESNYRAVNGRHGEIGPCQIKPTTAWHHFANQRLSLGDVRAMLGRVTVNVKVGYELLLSYGQDRATALEKYNSGKNKETYRKKVLEKLDRFRQEYRKHIVEDFALRGHGD